MPGNGSARLTGGSSLLPAGARLLLRALTHRLALLSLELEENRERLASASVLLALLTVVFVLAGMGLLLLVAAIYWDTSLRVTALALATGTLVAIAIGGAISLRRHWRNWHPFQATRATLEEDIQWLRRILRDPDRD